MDKTSFTTGQARLRRLLRAMREEAGLRQTDIAAKLNEHQSFVSKYENGKRRLDLIELQAVCNAMGVSLSKFVRRFEETDH